MIEYHPEFENTQVTKKTEEKLMKTDILIVGTGCSGLYCALNIPEEKQITIITKKKAEDSSSYLAQGGICVRRGEADFDSFFEDTLKAGHYENDRNSVEIMINSSEDVVNDLIDIGVDFNCDENGNLDYTKEGAHSKARILYHKDITGKEITSNLYNEVKKRRNIKIIENTTLIDIICENNRCFGAVVLSEKGELDIIEAEHTVLATGGIGGLYDRSTNYSHTTGDSIAIALRHGIEVKNLDYVQIHPTTFYTKEKREKSFLISESVRGEGAILLNKNMERFVDELLPRDVVSKAIFKQMEIDGTDHVWEDLRTIPEEELKSHFPNIIEHCKQNGYDVFKEPIPVVPAQHYFMGGIKVDYTSKTSMDGLYAVGETACNGVHGKNRLASNSLLESLVFAKRAAKDIAINPTESNSLPKVDFEKYRDLKKYNDENKKLVLDEINGRK